MLLFLRKNKFQIIKFLITGLLSSSINFLVYYFLYKLNVNINLASLSGYIIGIINSFVFSKIWIFNGSRFKKLNKAFIFFIFIYFLGGIEMTIIINVGIYLFGDYKLAWLFGAGIAAINNYLGSKFLIFKN